MCKFDISERTILKASGGRGRKQTLTFVEETFIVESVLEFQNNGTPLDRRCILDLAQTIVSTFPSEKRASIGFINDRPGVDWLKNFLNRHQ